MKNSEEQRSAEMKRDDSGNIRSEETRLSNKISFFTTYDSRSSRNGLKPIFCGSIYVRLSVGRSTFLEELSAYD